VHLLGRVSACLLRRSPATPVCLLRRAPATPIPSERSRVRLLGCVSACCALRQQRLFACYAVRQQRLLHPRPRCHGPRRPSRRALPRSRGVISRSPAPARPLAASHRALALQHALSRRHIALSRSSTPFRGDISRSTRYISRSFAATSPCPRSSHPIALYALCRGDSANQALASSASLRLTR
jgi:hypothetical protein